MNKYILYLCVMCSSFPVYAFVCEQSSGVLLEKAPEETAKLSQKFIRIDHIEVLPLTFDLTRSQQILKTVHILICGELISQTSSLGTRPGHACTFDSGCTAPMRCQNNVCVMPLTPASH